MNALGASHAQRIASSGVTCFCKHHERAAKERGIDFERARQGYQKLDHFVQAAIRGERPSDGYFVEFWRLLVEWPEIVAWDRLFDATKHQVLAGRSAIFGKADLWLRSKTFLFHENTSSNLRRWIGAVFHFKLPCR